MSAKAAFATADFDFAEDFADFAWDCVEAVPALNFVGFAGGFGFDRDFVDSASDFVDFVLNFADSVSDFVDFAVSDFAASDFADFVSDFVDFVAHFVPWVYHLGGFALSWDLCRENFSAATKSENLCAWHWARHLAWFVGW